MRHNLREAQNSDRVDVRRTWNLCAKYLKEMRRLGHPHPKRECDYPICVTDYWDWTSKYEPKKVQERRKEAILHDQLQNQIPWESTTMNVQFFMEL